MPCRSLGLLIGVGLLDLVMTAWLHAQGLIVELNPVMRPVIEQGEWLFALVKGGTLIVAWYAMATYARTNRDFVRKACWAGSLVYVTVWCGWFFATC